MADTEAMPPTPKMANADDGELASMSMSEAMDLLDEHGIDERNAADISAAIEIVFGEPEEVPAPQPDDQAMLGQLFAAGRPR